MHPIKIYSRMILLALPLFGCTHSPRTYVPNDLFVDVTNRPYPAELSRSEVHADVDLLIYALTTGYGGRKYVPSAAFLTALQDLQAIDKPMSPSELRDQIDSVLLVIPDNHLKARLDGKTSQLRRSKEKKASVGPNAASSYEKNWEVRIDRKKGRRILFISLTSFPSGRDPVWNGFLEGVRSLMPLSDAAVVDLRGNGGGDDQKGFSLASLFLGREAVPPVEKQIFSQTPQTFAIAETGYRVTKLRLLTEGRKVPKYLDDLIREQDENFELASQRKLPEERVEVNKKKHSVAQFAAYSKPVFILIDAACASSCESTVHAFETHPTVKRVGENTAGYIHFGDIGQLVLPTSRINVQMATKYDQYFDHRFLERVGITPDIRVRPGIDAYETVLNHYL
jgi:Peptidase family S41